MEKALAELRRRAEEIVSSMSRRDLVEYISRRDGYSAEFVTHNLVLFRGVEARLISRGYIPASAFVDYRRCARALFFKIRMVREKGGVLMTIDQLRSAVRGMIFHELYSKEYAVGETEVEVTSEKYRVGGRADEIREEPGRAVVVELKSGRPDPVAARLQVMSYMAALMERGGYDEVEGLVVWPGGRIRVSFDEKMYTEYLNRVRTVVEDALNGPLEEAPPRLSARLSYRCDTCPYRSVCIHSPDKYRTYENYFNAKSFTRLREYRDGGLLRYLKGAGGKL